MHVVGRATTMTSEKIYMELLYNVIKHRFYEKEGKKKESVI